MIRVLEVEQASETQALRCSVEDSIFLGGDAASLDNQCRKLQPLKVRPLCCPKHREPFSQPGSIIFSPTTLWRPKNLQGNSDFIIVYEEMFYLFKWKSMFSKLLFHFFIQKLHTDVTGVPWKIRFCHKVSTERPLIKSILMCMIYIYSSVPLLSYILHFPWF